MASKDIFVGARTAESTQRSATPVATRISIPSGYLTYPWKITIFKFGKPSISMGNVHPFSMAMLNIHLYHGYVSHNQMVRGELQSCHGRLGFDPASTWQRHGPQPQASNLQMLCFNHMIVIVSYCAECCLLVCF